MYQRLSLSALVVQAGGICILLSHTSAHLCRVLAADLDRESGLLPVISVRPYSRESWRRSSNEVVARTPAYARVPNKCGSAIPELAFAPSIKEGQSLAIALSRATRKSPLRTDPLSHSVAPRAIPQCLGR
jgi:hypothetical protein